MLIKAKTLTGKETEIGIEPTDKVERIKERVEEKKGIPPAHRICHNSNFGSAHEFQCVGTNNNCSLITCANPCFQLWDSKGRHKSAGCGIDPRPPEKPCGLSCEAARRPGTTGDFICCCTGDSCNHEPELPESFVSAAAAAATANQSHAPAQTVVTHEGTSSSGELIWLWFLIPTLFITLILASLLVYNKRRRRNQNSFHEEDYQLNQPMMMQMLTTAAAVAANQFSNNHHYTNNNNSNHLPNYHLNHHNNHFNKNYNQFPHHHYHHNPNHHHHNQTVETDLNETKIDLNTVKLLEVLGQGRFGMVHRAHIIKNQNNQDDNNPRAGDDSEQTDRSETRIIEPNEVAVKVIKADEYESWQNERYIYRSLRIKHPNILNYFYSSEHVESTTYWLIVEYAPLGSLCSYLKENTLEWEHFIDIALGIVRGLNHLHDVQIAHRDFKSSNILLKKDLTPCITDFGVAKRFDSPNGPVMDQKKYHQVGTPRYMAPEVLECNIVFTTSSIMKIDVYALSLVLWEVLSRTILLPTIANDDEYTPPPFMLPFEDVAGQKPTIAKMVQIVVQEKQRPPIRQEWINQQRLSDFCRSVLKEGWDTDFDSRISASCLLERVKIFVDRERSVSRNERQQ